MSAPRDTASLAERLEQYGPIAHLVTVGVEGVPHVVSVRVERRNGDLVMAAGRHTTANAAERPAVTLLWAAPPGRHYSLIVDGTARSTPEPALSTLAVTPTRAVLHRTADGDPSAPNCITLL
ncbi:MAG TPA: pyridoxamine 5'-phosphate oxidase family protein [Acidimicrobiales bacterium]|nr:pyridoxamine 5'-phosphate oxidase family protein [Acidimicrobiales bacterium]